MAEQLHPEDIYQTLEYEIVTLKIKPGETISENQLCKRFGISRTPVRAALQRLEQNGFVQIIPCKGTIVTPIDLDIVEDGTTFEENALIKAKAVAAQCNDIVLADDSGLEIDYLNKEPGIYSARYAGEDTSYDIKNQMLLDRLQGVPRENVPHVLSVPLQLLFRDMSRL